MAVWFSWQGECKDNVIPGSLLSSGYYEYEAFGADDFIVPKPEDAGEDQYFLSSDNGFLPTTGSRANETDISAKTKHSCSVCPQS